MGEAAASCSLKSDVDQECVDDDLRSVTTSPVTSLFQRVQLDSMERDWFRFAALGNAAALGQLLKQDPALASKKAQPTATTPALTREWRRRTQAVEACAVSRPLLYTLQASQPRATASEDNAAYRQARRRPASLQGSLVRAHQSHGYPMRLLGKKTARHWAAKHGRLEMAEMIAKAGVGVSIKSLRAACYTPQHIAALHSHSHIIQLLVGTYNAKANMRDYNGKTPKHYWKGSVDVFSTPSLDSCGRWAREEKRSHRYGHFPSILQNPRSWSQDRLWAEYLSSPELAVIKKGQARSPSCTRN